MSELIVAGFDDGHTAFLARAALARMQKRLSLPGQDLAVFTREHTHEATLQPVIDLVDEAEVQGRFWSTLAGLLFAADGSSAEAETQATTRLSAIGIDAAFKLRVGKRLPPGTAALLLVVSVPGTRDEVLAVLRGFQGRIERTKLSGGDDRHSWERSLLGSG